MGSLKRLVARCAVDVLDLVFPIACVGCGSYAEHRTSDAWICPACRAALREDFPTCVVCREPAPSGRTCFPCRRDTDLAGTLAIGPYHDPTLQSAVKRLKFSGARPLAQSLGALLVCRVAASVARGADRAFVLAPIPLHPRRERERGYNQSRLLADAMGQLLQVPVRELLVRVRSTDPQTTIRGSAHVRQANVHGAFALHPLAAPLGPTTIILVDDVLTTGATLREAARVLARQGAVDIWGAVAARGR